MTKIGTVIATDGNIATVEYYQKTICDSCYKRNKIGACDSCPNRTEQEFEKILAHNKIGASVGDKVEYVEAKSVNFIFTLLTFISPFICALIAYFISALFTQDEPTKIKIFGSCFAVALIPACIYSYKSSKKRCNHTIVSVVEIED